MYDRPDISVSLKPHCVVGIGASAGGLEALQQFLTFLPSNTGMAFVIIQHLAPNHKSMLADILAKYSAMPVTEISDGMEVQRNNIYMIPPKYSVEIENDTLHLKEIDTQEISHPIDIFFRSLAAAYENRSVAVIMSGTGSDGTNGIRAIKEQNGMILVQSPESSKFDGMPRNAISTGFVDLILKPDSIARELEHIARSMVDAGAQLQTTDDDLLQKVFAILKNVTNINYAYYKQTTILRRIERRLVVTHNRNLREYVSYMTNNPNEAKLLAKEVLIGVTSFFRDPEYFDVLKDTVIKKLLENAPADDEIRVWVAGCSTGEEAYSVAILFAEAMEEMSIHRDVKIFATDLDGDAITTAVRGIYGDNIIEDVSVSRLSKYFTRKGNKYAIHHDIRQMIIFAQHNVFQDPPFGKLNLICCRNVLIYFQTVLQRNLFAIFHMALSDKGYLFLGRSESVINYDDIFRTVCADEKIFIHNAAGKAPEHEQISYSLQNVEPRYEPIILSGMEDDDQAKYKTHELDTSVFEDVMPATVLINEKNELVRSYGDTSSLLSIPVGQVTLDIFMLIRNDLKIAVSTVLKESRQEDARITYADVPVKIDEEAEFITIVAQPVADNHGNKTGYTAVTFVRGGGVDMPGDMSQYQVDTAAAKRISDLEQELKLAKENLRQTVTELESTNAELQAANEELLTANEELQSSNEELQSVNEELYTVNSEYQSKVNELAAVNDDMANFLSLTLVGVLMVDKDLNIRKYTEYVSSEFNVAEQDVGRSLRYISFNFVTIDLLALCRQVLDTMVPLEQRCASISGKTYLIRIAPYRGANMTPDGKHDGDGEKKFQGLVLTFVDTTKQVDDQEQIDEMADALREAVRAGQEKERFLSHMSHDMRTPLTAIFGLTQLSLQDETLSEGMKDSLKKILTSSEYLLALIEEILETSRLNSGKVVSVSSAAKEESVIGVVASIISEQAKRAGLDFDYRITGSKDKYVLMDSKHVERAILNILSNSIKFTPKGGRVQLLTEVVYRDDKAIHTYTIRDNGIGISESFQKRMFLPFEQDADDGERDGTGLGLYITKNLIELMGGTISCKSSKGSGTEFTVIMSYPIATEEQISLGTTRSEDYEDQVLYGKNVLLAEDNRINAEVIIKILMSKGIHAEVATDGQEAVDMYRARGAYYYQAILMDLMMPGKGGVEAAVEIRDQRMADAQSIPIIALTADIVGDVEERCHNAGIDMLVEKPIDQARLFHYLAEKFDSSLN